MWIFFYKEGAPADQSELVIQHPYKGTFFVLPSLGRSTLNSLKTYIMTHLAEEVDEKLTFIQQSRHGYQAEAIQEIKPNEIDGKFQIKPICNENGQEIGLFQVVYQGKHLAIIPKAQLKDITLMQIQTDGGGKGDGDNEWLTIAVKNGAYPLLFQTTHPVEASFNNPSSIGEIFEVSYSPNQPYQYIVQTTIGKFVLDMKPFWAKLRMGEVETNPEYQQAVAEELKKSRLLITPFTDESRILQLRIVLDESEEFFFPKRLENAPKEEKMKELTINNRPYKIHFLVSGFTPANQ
jgi:hypothetical protein